MNNTSISKEEMASLPLLRPIKSFRMAAIFYEELSDPFPPTEAFLSQKKEMKNDDSIAGIHVAESSGVREIKPPQQNGGWKKGIVVFDFFLRLGGLAATIAATSAMGTSDQTLPFFTQFFQFEARYDDLPTFQFFVVAMGTVSVYLILSLIVSMVCIVQPLAVGPRLLLLILDAVALTLATAAAGAGAAIDYLAHNGNSNANWLAICNQFGDFCQKASGAVVASFVSIVVFIFLVLFSALALKKP